MKIFWSTAAQFCFYLSMHRTLSPCLLPTLFRLFVLEYVYRIMLADYERFLLTSFCSLIASSLISNASGFGAEWKSEGFAIKRFSFHAEKEDQLRGQSWEDFVMSFPRGGSRMMSWPILDGGLVQDRIEILGVGGVVALVRVWGPLVFDRAEEYHASHLSEKLEKRDHETHRTHHVESGDQPHLDGVGTSLLVPELLVTAFWIKTAAITFPLHAAGVWYPVLLGPCLDLEPIRVVAHAAAMKLKAGETFSIKIVLISWGCILIKNPLKSKSNRWRIRYLCRVCNQTNTNLRVYMVPHSW